ncbi:MAG: hypothetical protein MUC37_12550 [Hyphomicrobium sp.]|jgi:hypothetical protein|nr:hypothetical protein [Hyphomicrobium sp.]
MTEDDPRLAMIRGNAALVIEELGPVSGMQGFGYGPEAVAWVDGYIERQRQRMTDAGAVSSLVSVLGSYLGEAIIAAAGGRWDVHDRDEIGIRFDGGDWCFPFSKVAKQFAAGVSEGGESILSFYNVTIGFIASGGLAAAAGRPTGDAR